MAKTPAAPAPDDATAASTGSGKNRPTPSRAAQEAARKRPLVPDTKEAKARARAELAERRDKARIGMANGDERYLPVRDKGPQKKYVRDYVDARWNLGEILLPMLVLVIISYFFESVLVGITPYVLIGVWGVILVVVAEGVVVGIILRRKLAEKFGADRVERGVRWYAFMRMIQMRVLRLPKPQVKRGEFPS